MKKASWIVMGIFSILIGLYPIIYFLVDRRFGLLASKSEVLLSDTLWNIAFYGHIGFGGLALLIGWLQFSSRLRRKHLNLHRSVGKIYVISVFISGTCGLYIAVHATGGIIAILGFFTLGVIWLSTTFFGLRFIKQGDVAQHEKLMIYSYAACFAAVTLRIWLPMLTILLGGFTDAYRIVAWLCWVPNIIVAYFIANNAALKTKSILLTAKCK